MVSIDFSVFAEIFLFITLIFLLNELLYKPLLSKMAQRKEQLDVKSKLILEKSKEYSENREFITSHINATQKKAMEEVQKAVMDSETEKNEKINEAVEISIAEMTQVKSVVERRAKNVEKELSSQISSITQKISQTLLPLILIFFLVILPVGASETVHEEHGGDGNHGGISETARTFNFVVMIAILYAIGKKPISNAMKNRTRSVETSFEEREQKIEEIETSLAEIYVEREHVAEIEKSILDDAENRVHVITEEAHSETALKVKKIKESTEKQKSYEIENAAFRVRKYTVEHAMDEFITAVANGKLDVSTDSALISDCLEKMPQIVMPVKGTEYA